MGTSKLDGKEEEIRMLLEKEVSKTSITKIVAPSTISFGPESSSRRAQMADRGGSVLRAYFYSNLGGTLLNPHANSRLRQVVV